MASANAQVNGMWKQDHSEDENYDQMLREQEMGASRNLSPKVNKMTIESKVSGLGGRPMSVKLKGLGSCVRWLIRVFKPSPIEEYIINGEKITYRQYVKRNRPVEMNFTVGQPVDINIRGMEPSRAMVNWDEYGRLVMRHTKANGEFVTTGRIDSRGMLEMTMLLPSGKQCRRVLKRVQ